MKTPEIPFSLKLSSWLSHLILIVVLIGALLSFAFFCLSFTSVLDGLKTSLSIPASISCSNTAQVVIDGNSYDVEVGGEYASMIIQNPPKKYMRMAAVFATFLLLALAWISLSFKRFIDEVKLGKAFSNRNIRILRHIAFGLILLWVIRTLAASLFRLLVLSGQESAELTIGLQAGPHSAFLIVSLFLLVLAHILKMGSKIQEEHALTI